MINFDANATAPLCATALRAWLDAVEKFPGNASSQHRLGARSEAAMEQARAAIAAHLDCDPGLLIWTSGATESANLVFHHLAQSSHSDTAAWVSQIEHPCAIASVQRSFGCRVEWIPTEPSGRIDVESLNQKLRKGGRSPALIAVMAANNETGALQPWAEISEICRSMKIPFVCDATQWIGRKPARGLGACDYLFASAHKMGGPKGAGFLKIPDHQNVHSLLVGGPQESGRRAGTENLPAILAMSATLEDREARIGASEHHRHETAKLEFEQGLLERIPGTRLVAHDCSRLWNTAMAIMPPLGDCQQRWVVKLDRAGFAASTGSACSSGKEKSSHVLEAMGFDSASAAQALRFSVAWESDPAHWNLLLEALVKILKSTSLETPQATA